MLTCHGDEHGTDGALSSEQRVLVTVPLATHVNCAVRDVVNRAAPEVSDTRGAAVVGGGGGGGAVVTVQLYDALALPAEFATVTRNECAPAASPLYDFGDVHETAAPPSSEQVVVETVPVVDQPNVAVVDVVDDAGPLPRLTVGALGVGAVVTVQLYDALALPAEFATVTRNECAPAASPLYDFGDVHETAAPPSSEQVVVETVPVVDQPNVAVVDVVDDAGPLVRLTVGAETPPPPPVFESSYVPNSCDQ